MIRPGFPRTRAGELISGNTGDVWPPLGNGSEAEGWRMGHTEISSSDVLAASMRRIYADILGQVPEGWALCRLWHFVPDINEPTSAGRDRYMDFCMGREAGFADSSLILKGWPAASAVGAGQSPGLVAFVLTRGCVRLVENPFQTPAWRYPERYGPSPPAFSRACEVKTPGESVLFVSGTASVRGSETLHAGDTLSQIQVTEENLREVSMAAGWGRDFGGTGVRWRHWRVYLRHKADLPAAQAWLARVAGPADLVVMIQADICRADLMLEVDLTVCR